MAEFIAFIGIIIALLIDYFIAKEFRFIAAEKGYDNKKYFWWTFLLAAVGISMVIALPKKSEEQIAREYEKKVTEITDNDIPEI